MEENNSKSIIKIAVVAAIVVILGINVYRTEQCKKEISNLSTTVEGYIMYQAISSNANDSTSINMTAEDDLSINPDCSDKNVTIVQGVSQEQFAELSESVSRLESKVAALQGKGQTAGSTTIVQGASKEEFSKLEGSVSTMQSKITALQSKVEQLTKSQTQMSATLKRVATASSSGSSSSRTFSSTSSSTTQAASSSSTSFSSGTASSSVSADQKGRVTVSAKVKVEDRYVPYRMYLPNISEGPVGKVVVNITIEQSGSVVSARINPESTISDEDILDACKEAALKTGFSYNPEAPSKQTGTITYTFTAR